MLVSFDSEVRKKLLYDFFRSKIGTVAGDHWQCEYEIGWPDNTRRSKADGVDSVQSLLLALKKIGADICTSEAHKSGKLIWEKRGDGYGFPLPAGIRDLYEGSDRFL